MKLAVSMYSYHAAVKDGRLDVGGFIREAARIQADGVELLDFYYGDPDETRAAIRQALDETGLPVPIFSVGNNFAKISGEERQAELQKIRFGVDEAKRWGAGVVRVFAGDVAEGITFDQAREWIVEGLAEASRYADAHGVKLALENHGTLAGRGEQVRGLIEDVRAISKSEALGANPDTGNFLLVGQPSHEAIEQVARFANMVHFKDFVEPAPDFDGWAWTTPSGQKLIGCCVGEGKVELKACLDHLRSAGFDGWLSMEYEGPEDPMEAVPRGFANARRYQ